MRDTKAAVITVVVVSLALACTNNCMPDNGYALDQHEPAMQNNPHRSQILPFMLQDGSHVKHYHGSAAEQSVLPVSAKTQASPEYLDEHYSSDELGMSSLDAQQQQHLQQGGNASYSTTAGTATQQATAMYTEQVSAPHRTLTQHWRYAQQQQNPRAGKG